VLYYLDLFGDGVGRYGVVRCISDCVSLYVPGSTGVYSDEWVIHIGHIIVEIESCLLSNQKYFKLNIPQAAESGVLTYIGDTIPAHTCQANRDNTLISILPDQKYCQQSIGP